MTPDSRLRFADLRRAMDRDALSPLDVVERCLARIEAREADVLAWAHVDAEGARGQAKALGESRGRGPLHGVPVGVKDIIAVAGMPTGCGSAIVGERIADEDAACVCRLRAAGAIILGKTVTTEFATSTPAETRNPLSTAHTPGGSSSGSAAAVADGMVPLALGSQTVGSTIRPASYCGLIGLKPTHGDAALDGVRVHSDALDTIGLMAADPAGVTAMWEVVADRRPAPPAELTPARVGVLKSPWWSRTEAAARRALTDAVDGLRRCGVQVEWLELDEVLEPVAEAHWTMTMHDVARGLAEYAGDDRLSPGLRQLVELGLAVTEAQWTAAVSAVDAARRDLDLRWASHDALLMPAATGEAPLLADGAGTGDPIFCQPWSALGYPAVTYPAGRGVNGLPVGVQLVGPRGSDLQLLQLASLLQ